MIFSRLFRRKARRDAGGSAAISPVQIPDNVRSFLEGLLEDAGMDSPLELGPQLKALMGYDSQEDVTAKDLMPEMREEQLQQLYVRFDRFLTITIIENMDPSFLDKFMQMNEQNRTPQEIEAFLRNAIPNVEEVMTDAHTEFRKIYLDAVRRSREST